MQAFWTEIVNFAESITTTVGDSLLEAFGKVQAEEKSDGSLVTEFDKWADERLRTAIHEAFPDHGVLSEETVHEFPDKEWCWVIDPIDGTTNFTQGIPIWAVSLGLLYQGTPVFGHIYVPPLGHHFQGYWSNNTDLNVTNGAFLNGQSIRVRLNNPGKNEFFSLCSRSNNVLKQPFPCKVRMLGAATYNLLIVAAGYAVGAVEATPKVWDIAGIWPILHAAGAIWTPLDNQPPFPLEIGKNYRDHPFPTLITNRADIVEKFRSLVGVVVSP
ncbi:inositol monophosphatase family protein [Oscillatoria sp. CS-180]|uniref:inositol monophosphatase family protein n=1 Tax=Oscillatoria sp. CS-180 TaxID=3021720 RepID=UPI00232D5E93|nr:inositol monophosphatase family protein [Oscillatoria sp. CS-180]MDB9527801.1 inositol monophosphatase family protein [Oscillatoria sp. CS-180]